MSVDGNIDYYGIAIGIISFFLAFLYVFHLLEKYDLNRKSILNSVILSATGHFIGAAALYWFAITAGADSVFYFKNATMQYQGLGYFFAFLVLGYAKAYVLGESFLGAFMISGALGFIASVYYLLTYKILLDKISNHTYELDRPQLIYPAFLLLCWPSYFFWSAAIIKDNFAFISISLILFAVADGRVNVKNLVVLSLGAFLGFMVRPYLFIIFTMAALIYLMIGSRWNLFFKVGLIGLMALLTTFLLPLLGDYAMMVHFSGSTLTNIGEYAVRQQQYNNIGSSIPLPTHNPHLAFLFLPYMVFIDLFLPLGIGANNFIGLISSVENAYLLSLYIFLLRNWDVWKNLYQKYRIIMFYMIYSFVGMSCLSIMNSNLGLAMREKMMYVPAGLICIFLTFAYKRVLILQNDHHVEEDNLAYNAKY